MTSEAAMTVPVSESTAPKERPKSLSREKESSRRETARPSERSRRERSSDSDSSRERDSRRGERRRRKEKERRARRRSPSPESSEEEYMSDEDERSPGAKEWMREHGRDPRAPPLRLGPFPSILVACVDLNRLSVKGKYGTWNDYIRFLHRYSRRCRPPPGREPPDQTAYVHRNFLRTLHVKDRSKELDLLIAAPLPF
jgi:hypothetical protein